MKEELLKELETAREITKDYGKFKHLFSDGADGTLAKLNRAVSRIVLLLAMNELKDVAHPTNKAIEDGWMHKIGTLVKIRPCGEEYKNKTYLGFYIGDIALGSSISVTDEKIQLNFSGHNPAIFVPEIGKIIYGCESWWGEIKDEKELSSITDSDIQNVWYVKLLKQMQDRTSCAPEPPQGTAETASTCV
jgi:hypothetical protein